MTLEELDAELDAKPDATAVILAACDRHIMDGETAKQKQSPTVDGEDYVYRGRKVWVIATGSSRVSNSVGL